MGRGHQVKTMRINRLLSLDLWVVDPPGFKGQRWGGLEGMIIFVNGENVFIL